MPRSGRKKLSEKNVMVAERPPRDTRCPVCGRLNCDLWNRLRLSSFSDVELAQVVKKWHGDKCRRCGRDWPTEDAAYCNACLKHP